MMVPDANILIREVLGTRVRQILEMYSTRVQFVAPDTALEEAREHLPGIFRKRGSRPDAVLSVLDELTIVIGSIGNEIYSAFETDSRQRLW